MPVLALHRTHLGYAMCIVKMGSITTLSVLVVASWVTTIYMYVHKCRKQEGDCPPPPKKGRQPPKSIRAVLGKRINKQDGGTHKQYLDYSCS